jgi:CBS domain-containing protein
MQLTDTIRSILSRKGSEVWSVTPHTSVYDAIEIMSEKEIGALPVIEDGKLLGILSERDYARKIILKGKASKQTEVQEIMSSPVLTVTSAHNVEDCMRLMTAHRSRHLPVVDSSKVVGMVSIGDLVNWIISAQAETIDHLHNYIEGRYPG